VLVCRIKHVSVVQQRYILASASEAATHVCHAHLKLPLLLQPAAAGGSCRRCVCLSSNLMQLSSLWQRTLRHGPPEMPLPSMHVTLRPYQSSAQTIAPSAAAAAVPA
jgi:hypothetical protein